MRTRRRRYRNKVCYWPPNDNVLSFASLVFQVEPEMIFGIDIGVKMTSRRKY